MFGGAEWLSASSARPFRHSLPQGYEVHGIVRRSSSFNTGRIDHLYRCVVLVFGGNEVLDLHCV